MPRKDKKVSKNSVSLNASTSGFCYPSIDFASLPKKDVFAYKFEELIPGVLICDDVFTRNECQLLVQSCKEYLDPTNKNNAPPKKGEAFRNNERYFLGIRWKFT